MTTTKTAERMPENGLKRSPHSFIPRVKISFENIAKINTAPLNSHQIGKNKKRQNAF